MHYTLKIIVEVPAPTPADSRLYIAGDFNAWNPSNPHYRLRPLTEQLYSGEFVMEEQEARFKITRGSWETAEVDTEGDPVCDHHWFAADEDEPMLLSVAAWLDQHPKGARHQPRHTLSGDVRVIKDVYCAEFNYYRDLLVYLPPDYRSSGHRRYPVIYAQDGQNLFDDVTAYAGEWQLDEICERMARDEGIAFIVVGIPNAGKRRLDEYSPWRDEGTGQGGCGAEYINWLADDVKPRIDAEFRTMRTPDATAILGSSMGGLISLCGGLLRPDVFGVIAAMSPTVMYGGGRLFEAVAEHATSEMNIYLDQGGQEYPGFKVRSQRLVEATEKLASRFIKASARIQFVIDPSAIHNEAAWTKRLPGVLRFIWSCVKH